MSVHVVDSDQNGAAILDHPALEAPVQDLLEKLGITVGEEWEVGEVQFEGWERDQALKMMRSSNPIHKGHGSTSGVVHGDVIAGRMKECLLRCLERKGFHEDNFGQLAWSCSPRCPLYWKDKVYYPVTAEVTEFNSERMRGKVTLRLYMLQEDPHDYKKKIRRLAFVQTCTVGRLNLLKSS